jgi:hypothetical protein
VQFGRRTEASAQARLLRPDNSILSGLADQDRHQRDTHAPREGMNTLENKQQKPQLVTLEQLTQKLVEAVKKASPAQRAVVAPYSVPSNTHLSSDAESSWQSIGTPHFSELLNCFSLTSSKITFEIRT